MNKTNAIKKLYRQLFSNENNIEVINRLKNTKSKTKKSKTKKSKTLKSKSKSRLKSQLKTKSKHRRSITINKIYKRYKEKLAKRYKEKLSKINKEKISKRNKEKLARLNKSDNYIIKNPIPDSANNVIKYIEFVCSALNKLVNNTVTVN